MRVFCEGPWGLPRENVIGSAPEFAYLGGPLVPQAAPYGPVALGPGKPEDVLARTGRLPALAAGAPVRSARRPRRRGPDEIREYACTDCAERARATGEKSGWTTVGVKDEWNVVLKERLTQEEPSAPHQRRSQPGHTTRDPRVDRLPGPA
ncbi:hypothetical protein [Streptomyces chartreusis]|uniref:hypothetical protein n=1 Tax=Streptomyces chartreusis TaxID=1969 RepID=UPI0036398127